MGDLFDDPLPFKYDVKGICHKSSIPFNPAS